MILYAAILSILGVMSEASPLENRVDQVVSVFENGTTVVQYCAIENISDGRGYTAGKAGFTSATGDLYELIRRYDLNHVDSPFKPLESLLEKRAREESPSTEGLESLPGIWKQLCATPDFIEAQDLLADEYYKRPAREHLKEFGLKSPLAYLIFHDTVLQQGDGRDPDSFSGVIIKMRALPKTEELFLSEFLRARIQILNHAFNPATREVWKESVDRAHALNRLLKSHQLSLRGPFTLHVWETDYTIR
jgi:chitosanase